MSIATHLSAASIALALSIGTAGAADQKSAAAPGEFSILQQTHAVPMTADELGTVRGTFWAVSVRLDVDHFIVSILTGKGPTRSPNWTNSAFGSLSGIEVGPYLRAGAH